MQELPEILKRRVDALVQLVPAGNVSTYGDIAALLGGGIDARTVGYALNAIPKNETATVPWQRVVNAQGGISTKGLLQRHLLEGEGVVFAPNNRIDLKQYRWPGPTAAWAACNGYETLPPTKSSGEQLSLL